MSEYKCWVDISSSQLSSPCQVWEFCTFFVASITVEIMPAQKDKPDKTIIRAGPLAYGFSLNVTRPSFNFYFYTSSYDDPDLGTLVSSSHLLLGHRALLVQCSCMTWKLIFTISSLSLSVSM
jgi:hypothetical protein